MEGGDSENGSVICFLFMHAELVLEFSGSLSQLLEAVNGLQEVDLSKLCIIFILHIISVVCHIKMMEG